MVSTYISPLGIAYTGLLVVPIAVALIGRRDQSRRAVVLAAVVGALLLGGILFSVTRLALLCLVGEMFLVGLVIRTRLTWMLPPIVVAAVATILFGYPAIGPTVDPYLLPGESHRHTILYIGDPSFTEHIRALVADAKLVSEEPLGIGLGGSVHRFTQTLSDTAGTGESAVFGVFGDTGIVGGMLYVALYGLGVFYGWLAMRRTPRRRLALALPLVAGVGGLALIPITLTSDVWGDLSVTFLYWWAAGYSASVAQQHVLAVDQDRITAGRQAA